MDKEFKVSVRLMTYNHEAFIEQAMEGILAQVTDFKVEVVIGDDFSKDRTLELIQKYSSTARIHIRVLPRKEGDDYWKERQKRGRLYNFSNIMEHCNGEYIALLDGDDYWIDPFKLQKQVDFLEEHPNCSVCFTAAQYLFEEEPDRVEVYRPAQPESEKVYTLSQAIRKAGEFMPTATVLFRAEYLNELPDWVFDSLVGDMPLSLYLGTKGNYGYVDRISSMYRIMAPGSWSARMTYKRRKKKIEGFVKILNDFDAYTQGNYAEIVRKEKKRILKNEWKAKLKNSIARFIPLSLAKAINKNLGKRIEYFR
jgi:glycosyltransferase involved in cell wall biosynthesis